MEKTINRPVASAGEKSNIKRNVIRAGALALSLGIGAGILIDGTAAGEPNPTAKAEKRSDKVFFVDGHRYKGFILPKIFAELGKEDTNKVDATTTTTLPPTTTTTAPPRIAYDAGLWQQLHQCEQAETWHAGGHFGNGLVSGGNGLGMSRDAWSMAVHDAAQRGVTLPATGWDASIDQQMQAAQVFYEEEGWGWACHVGGH